MTPLGDLDGGDISSQAQGVSADGSVVVGYVGDGPEAFRWENGTMTGLGDLSGGTFASYASAVSADGSVVVGTGYSGDGAETFVWDAVNNMRSLKDILTNDYGLDLTGWNLTKAYGVSDDGYTIVGYGENPDGDDEAWMVVITPEPTNDDCTYADTVFEDIAVNDSTTGKTASGITTSCSGTDTIDLWYSFTPTVTSDYFISLCGSSFDTTLGLFSDCAGTEIACNNDYCGEQSKIDTLLTAGTTYLIRVSGDGGATGDFDLLITAYEEITIADTLEPSTPETLIPSGGDPSATESAQIEIENTTGPSGAAITVSEIDTDLYQGQHAFNVMGTTLVVDTSLTDCQFFATVSIPFTLANLNGAQWQSLDLMYWDVTSESWTLAAAGNCGNNPSTLQPVGNRFQIVNAVTPTLSPDLGDYGVFYNPVQEKGFVWANIDHTTDFTAALLIGDFATDGTVNFKDFAVLASAWLSDNSSTPNWNPTCDLDNSGIINTADLKTFSEQWLK